MTIVIELIDCGVVDLRVFVEDGSLVTGVEIRGWLLTCFFRIRIRVIRLF